MPEFYSQATSLPNDAMLLLKVPYTRGKPLVYAGQSGLAAVLCGLKLWSFTSPATQEPFSCKCRWLDQSQSKACPCPPPPPQSPAMDFPQFIYITFLGTDQTFQSSAYHFHLHKTKLQEPKLNLKTKTKTKKAVSSWNLAMKQFVLLPSDPPKGDFGQKRRSGLRAWVLRGRGGGGGEMEPVTTEDQKDKGLLTHSRQPCLSHQFVSWSKGVCAL